MYSKLFTYSTFSFFKTDFADDESVAQNVKDSHLNNKHKKHINTEPSENQISR